MARRSARLSSQQGSSPAPAQSSPPSSSPATAGRKRKAKNESAASPSAKRGKKDEKDEKQQQTIEDTMDIEKDKPEQSTDINDSDSKPQDAGKDSDPIEPQEAAKDESKSVNATDDARQHEETNGHSQEGFQPENTSSKPQPATNGEESKETKESTSDDKPEPQPAPETKTNGDAVEPHARDEKVPSSILEKGIFYFLYRGRVNIESPDNVQDIARSYLILRPLPHGAKLSDGAMGDDKNCRLIAIPKKMLPVSGKDRWTAFVEKSNLSIKDLKESFLKANDYETQAGSRHSPAATPAAEGVYAITTTGRESHMAYITTLPENPGTLQNDLGLKAQGSFVLSTKNPKAPGPANADIGKDPGYPQEILDKFRALRWAPTEPKMLDYEGCQFLMIGEGEKGLEKATEPQDGDEKKTDPKDELEKLEGEDEIRVEHLNGEDAVFADLGTNAKDYPKLQTTW